MTEPQSICGAICPDDLDLTCLRPPGTNAFNEERNENVHVHYARREVDSAVFHWEDPPSEGA